jgi:hypothetical protein
MDQNWLNRQPWRDSLRLDDDGIWRIKHSACAIGIVVMAHQDERFVLIQKGRYYTLRTQAKVSTLEGRAES